MCCSEAVDGFLVVLIIALSLCAARHDMLHEDVVESVGIIFRRCMPIVVAPESIRYLLLLQFNQVSVRAVCDCPGIA